MKLKKWLLALATFAVMAVLCAVAAGAETYGDLEYSVLGDGTVKITGYNGSAEKVDIPSKIENKSVTSIGYRAFRGCTSLTSITIPDSVTSIGYSAFRSCSSLTSITIPGSVTSIGDGAFECCTSLTGINVASDNSNYASVNGVLYDKNKTTIICYPAGKDINYKIPDGVTEIGWYAFKSCTSLKSITIPNSVAEIGGCAFKGCTSLKSITIPDSVTEIGEQAFKDCTSLKSATIPSSVSKIVWYAFDGCSSLTSITIPDSVTKIGAGAFRDCSSLKSINIPDNVTSIGNETFYGCTSLTSITIPDSVTSIGNWAFGGGCTSLTEINVASENSDYVSVNGVLYNKDKNTIICYPAGKKGINYKIPGSVTSIGDGAFYGCSSLTSVTIPNGVTEIDQSAFEGCTSLKSVAIPSSVTSIDNWAFGYYFGEDYNSKKIDNFKIYCYSGTSGERYAKDNGFAYELLDEFTLAEVTGVKVKTQGSNSLTLAWNKNAAATGYVIEQYKGGKWVQIAKTASNAVVSYTVNGLAAETAYTFRIKAYVILGGTEIYSDYTRLAAKTRIANVGTFKGSTVSDSAVKLDWSRNDKATGYVIEQYKGGKWTALATTKNNTTLTFTVKGLASATVYSFRIKSFRTVNGKTDYSEYTSLKAATSFGGVNNLTVKSYTASAITLAWNKNASANGYVVEQYKGGKWTQIAKTSSNATVTYAVNGLKADTTYTFRVRAYKTAAGKTIYSEYARLAAKTRIAKVASFRVTGTTTSAVELSWNKNAKATGYIIEIYRGGKWTAIATTKNNTTLRFTMKGLARNTTYSFRIKAFRTLNGTTEFSEYSSLKAATRK